MQYFTAQEFLGPFQSGDHMGIKQCQVSGRWNGHHLGGWKMLSPVMRHLVAAVRVGSRGARGIVGRRWRPGVGRTASSTTPVDRLGSSGAPTYALARIVRSNELGVGLGLRLLGTIAGLLGRLLVGLLLVALPTGEL